MHCLLCIIGMLVYARWTAIFLHVYAGMIREFEVHFYCNSQNILFLSASAYGIRLSMFEGLKAESSMVDTNITNANEHV